MMKRWIASAVTPFSKTRYLLVWGDARSPRNARGDIIDVKKIKEEARKKVEKEGNPQFASKLSGLFKKKQEGCSEVKAQ